MRVVFSLGAGLVGATLLFALPWPLFAWSQSLWGRVFPSPPTTSAPSSYCFLAMMATNVALVTLAVALAALITRPADRKE